MEVATPYKLPSLLLHTIHCICFTLLKLPILLKLLSLHTLLAYVSTYIATCWERWGDPAILFYGPPPPPTLYVLYGCLQGPSNPSIIPKSHLTIKKALLEFSNLFLPVGWFGVKKTCRWFLPLYLSVFEIAWGGGKVPSGSPVSNRGKWFCVHANR